MSKSEFRVKIRRQLLHLGVELFVAFEVVLVHVALERGHHVVPLAAHRVHLDVLHGVIVGPIKPRTQKRVRLCLPRGRVDRIDRLGYVCHV